MEIRARFYGIKWDIDKPIVAFEFDGVDGLDEITDKDLDLSIKIHREKRSLNANAYYQELSHKIAKKQGISHAEYHNRVLAELGVPERIEGHIQWYLAPDTEWWLKQLEGTDHFCPTDKKENRNGNSFRWFFLLKPTRRYDTKEMSNLIDYVIQDAESLGIQIKSDDEIKKMKEEWNDRKKE